MKTYINYLLKKREETYLQDPNLIVQDYNSENKMVDEYNGRQLLEMLQNANDACVTENEKACYIELKDNTLIIANNGKGFDKGGIIALMYIDLSSKQDDDTTIGKKGLGFRSILSWAKSVIVKSNGFALEFSRENAIDYLKKLINKKPSIAEELKELSKEQYPIASLRCPKLIDIQDQYNDYDTYIVLKLKDDFDISVIENQIEKELNLEVLLFLNHLTKIVVNTPNHQFCLSKIENPQISNVEITRKNLNTNETIAQNAWTVLREQGYIEGNFYELKVAWDRELRNNIGMLYSYFKTDVELKFPCLVHGTFDLTADRNHFVNESAYNQALIVKLADILIKAAITVANNEVSYKPLKMLSIQNTNIDSYFKKYDFTELIEKKVREHNILPTIGNKYISIEDKPKYMEKHNYAELLSENVFADLLQYTSDKDLVCFIKKIGVQEYDRETFFAKLTEISCTLSMESRRKLIQYVYDDYKPQYEDRRGQYGGIYKHPITPDIKPEDLPSLWVDECNQVIKANVDKYIKDETHALPISNDIAFVHPDLLKEINNDVINWYGIQQYTLETAYKLIHKKYESDIESDKTIEEKKIIIVQHLTLLAAIYRSNRRDDLKRLLESKKVYVLHRLGEIKPTIDVYFGEEYDCELCEKLFHYDQGKFLASQQSLSLDIEDERDFYKFLGVAEKPRLKRLRNKAEKDYLEYALRKYPYKKKKFDNKYSSYDDIPQPYDFKSHIVSTIQDIENILNHNNYETIIWWLWKSNYSKSEDGQSIIHIHIPKMKHDRQIESSDMPSYIMWKIGQIAWLDTKSGKKVKPSECCLSQTLTEAFSPPIEIPQINYASPIFKEHKITKDDVDDILQSVHVKAKISEVDSKTIYSIIKALPEIDPQGEIASAIYKEIANNYKTENIIKSECCYQNHIQQGFVYAQRNNEAAYQSVQNVYYVPSDKYIPKDVMSHFWTMDIGRRPSSKKIEELFGVYTIPKISYSVNSHFKGKHNEDLLQKVEKAKPLFYAFKVNEDEDGKIVQSFKDLKIIFCSEVEALFQYQDTDAKLFTLAPYEYVLSDKQYYVLLNDGDSISNLKIANTISNIVVEWINDSTQTLQNQYKEIFEHLDNDNDIDVLFNQNALDIQCIAKAKEKMDICDDPKTIFWIDLLSAVEEKKSYYQKITEKELAEKVYNQLKITIDDYDINYNELNSESNIDILSELFNDLNIKDLTHFSAKLDFKPFYKKKLDNLKKDEQDKFASLYFNRLKEKNIEQQKYFVSKLDEYEDFSFDIPEIVADIPEFFYQSIEKEFELNLREEMKERISIREVYKTQEQELIKKMETLPSPNEKLLKDIIADKQYRSLIHLGHFDEILQKYQEQNKNRQTEDTEYADSKTDYRDFTKGKTMSEASSSTQRVEDVKSEETDSGKKYSYSQYTRSSSKTQSTKSKNTEESGKSGERLVYDFLIKKYGEDKVIWESGYAKDMGENILGSDNKHYDMRYNENGEWIYVEVKTNQKESKEFKLTKAEVDFGREKGSYYEVYHITNIESEKPCYRIFKPFDCEDFTQSESFSAIPDGYIIRYKER